MFKNIFYKSIAFVLLFFVFNFGIFSFVKAEDTLPNNVKITTSQDGNSTIVVIESKPGFTTSVQTNCIDGKCTSSATQTEISKTDVKKIKDNIKKQQEAMEKFWKLQDEFFKQRQKIFEDLWGIGGF